MEVNIELPTPFVSRNLKKSLYNKDELAVIAQAEAEDKKMAKHIADIQNSYLQKRARFLPPSKEQVAQGRAAAERIRGMYVATRDLNIELKTNNDMTGNVPEGIVQPTMSLEYIKLSGFLDGHEIEMSGPVISDVQGYVKFSSSQTMFGKVDGKLITSDEARNLFYRFSPVLQLKCMELFDQKLKEYKNSPPKQVPH